MRYFLLLLICTNTMAAVSYEEYRFLETVMQKAFLELRPSEDHFLEVNKPPAPSMKDYWWNIDNVHASYSGYEDEGKRFHHIFLFGGFVRMPDMTLDSLAITACHELGHGIGGAPFKQSGSSMEGQSDYYATKECLKVVYKYIPQKFSIEEMALVIDPAAKELCDNQSDDLNHCYRAMIALESDISFYRYLGEEVSFSQRAQEVATELNDENTFYPSAQCRFDTSINGLLEKERPACWYIK
ncbi:hypothetical protein [Bacteriovorax sp. BSW11_IV]|uniref:hypothetical protein n=1 Tax=Bacteriovorax sp. BSW11_IV TaxID=1353529 RepID=UPI00055156A3|nr:hypothetical protein [Bacteriovorax sp. BSW11_IV]